MFGRHEGRRSQFVTRLKTEFGVEALATRSVAEAVEGAPIVTVVTRATEPILSAAMMARGAHINAVGAIVPRGAELAADVLARSTRVVVDSVPQAQKLSRELMDYFGPGPEKWEQVESLASLVAARRGRAESDDLTLFKSLGMGISDLSLGIELYQRALSSGVGRSFAHPQKATPRLGAPQQANPLTGA